METEEEEEGRHEGHYFRALRPDEVIDHLQAKNPHNRAPSSQQEREELIEEHIRYGSQPGYKSPWLSLTADLDVAPAFAGPVSRIAVIRTDELQSEKKKTEIKRLDKEYLRSVLTEKDAVARSRRSDEVLVYGGVKCAQLLDLQLVSSDRMFAPGFEEEDGQQFTNQLDRLPRALEAIGGSNKRMFRVEIEGKTWVAALPRPNYCLDKKVLFGSELVQLARHQFSILCSYRSLEAPVPKAALYTFKLSTSFRAGEYESAIILMEDLSLGGLVDDTVNEAVHALFPIDILFCNWDLQLADLSNPGCPAYALTREGRTVRLCMDRALGCTYPEDRRKEDKFIMEFLPEYHRPLLCTGKELMTQKQLVQRTFDLKLTELKRLGLLRRSLGVSQGLPWEDDKDLWSILSVRIKQVLNTLPFYEIEPRNKNLPLARDGHGAVVCDNFMFVCGGNSKNQGPLKDLWKLDLAKELWTRLPDMPAPARYSFSMHLWNHTYIVVFGGCTKGDNGRMRVVSDLQIYNIIENAWITPRIQESKWPDARCRHGSHLVNLDNGSAEMYLIGGMDSEQKKRKDVWKLLLACAKDPEVSWSELPDMKVAVHQGFSFGLKSKVFLIGGFGQTFRKLKEVSGSGEIVITHDLRNLPVSERNQFLESDSLAGFGAVYDEVGERLILIGGGNVGRPNLERRRDKSFGNVSANVKSDSRILCLNHCKDSSQRSWTQITNTPTTCTGVQSMWTTLYYSLEDAQGMYGPTRYLGFSCTRCTMKP